MKRLVFALIILLPGCMMNHVNVYGNDNKITIEQPKTVTASPVATASGNTVPVLP